MQCFGVCGSGGPAHFTESQVLAVQLAGVESKVKGWAEVAGM